MSTKQSCSNIVIGDKKYNILIQNSHTSIKILDNQYRKTTSNKVHNIVIPGTTKVELSIGCS